MNKGKVLIAAPVHSVLTEGLVALGYEVVTSAQITRNEAFVLLTDCVGIITSTRLMLDAELLEAAPQLKWIGRMGSGMEVIDLQHAAAKGIECFSSPEGNRNAVAEHALGMLLGIIRHIPSSMQEIGEGKWLREENRGTELEGKTIAIIGFGNTGRAFVKILQGFNMNILVYDKNPIDNPPNYVTICADIQCIYDQVDIVSFHVPIQPDTYRYVNANFLLKMTQAFILINTSRGEVVDTEVLEKGLAEGKIIGAGIDVWPEEPLERMGIEERGRIARLVKLPQVIITPHIAGYTHEALFKMSSVLFQKISIISN